jgi:hypothetical protein
MDKEKIIKMLTSVKRREEEDVYDEFSDGYGVLCVPLCVFKELEKGDDFEDFEINVPTYYFKKMLDENKIKVCHDSDDSFFIADFYYDSFLGAIFDPKMVEKLSKGLRL